MFNKKVNYKSVQHVTRSKTTDIALVENETRVDEHKHQHDMTQLWWELMSTCQHHILILLCHPSPPSSDTTSSKNRFFSSRSSEKINKEEFSALWWCWNGSDQVFIRWWYNCLWPIVLLPYSVWSLSGLQLVECSHNQPTAAQAARILFTASCYAKQLNN